MYFISGHFGRAKNVRSSKNDEKSACLGQNFCSVYARYVKGAETRKDEELINALRVKDSQSDNYDLKDRERAIHQETEDFSSTIAKRQMAYH